MDEPIEISTGPARVELFGTSAHGGLVPEGGEVDDHRAPVVVGGLGPTPLSWSVPIFAPLAAGCPGCGAPGEEEGWGAMDEPIEISTGPARVELFGTSAHRSWRGPGSAPHYCW